MLELFAEADRVQAEISVVNVRVAEARRRWARAKSPETSAAMAAAEDEARRLHAQFDALVGAMEEASGLTAEQFDALEAAQRSATVIVVDRNDLTAQKIAPTRHVEDDLADAIDRIKRVLPRGWLDVEAADAGRLRALAKPNAFLSLTKNLRPESEFPTLHRFRQAIYVADDLLNGRLGYDHFAGAALVPAIAQLGRELESIQGLRTNGNDRVRRLWTGPSNEVDATLFELLVAGGCVERGRSVEFIPEGPEKTADIRANDPFPLLIECKRQDAITPYELAEEEVVRAIFTELRANCRQRGIMGRFALTFTRECAELDRREVVDKALESVTTGPSSLAWGTVSFREISARAPLSASTPIFSPRMLEEIFGWNSDLPDSDGICASFENNADFIVHEVAGAIGLTWVNVADEAIRKRTWAPVGLLNQAVQQITPGEWGLVYIAYQEGARSDIADARLRAFQERLDFWSHRGDIRVPIIFLVRLYPRALGDGQPDLIENAVQLLSSVYGDRELVDQFPSAVFTKVH